MEIEATAPLEADLTLHDFIRDLLRTPPMAPGCELITPVKTKASVPPPSLPVIGKKTQTENGARGTQSDTIDISGVPPESTTAKSTADEPSGSAPLAAIKPIPVPLKEAPIEEAPIKEASIKEARTEESVNSGAVGIDLAINEDKPSDPIQHSASEYNRPINQKGATDSASEPVFIDESLRNQPSSGRPEWAAEPFETLLFRVGDLLLGAPLAGLGQIQPVSETLTPIPGQPNWMMGLQSTSMGKGQIGVIDTLKYIDPGLVSTAAERKHPYVCTLSGIPWGLTVDKVERPLKIDPSQVKWLIERSRQHWAAGILKEHMCILVDVFSLANELLKRDRNRNRLA